MKIERLLGILMLLINRKKVTAKELADHFDVSVRTIQRDMDTLTLAGIPLYADVGVNGGYQLLEHYKMDKNFLNVDESKVLIGFLESLQQVSPNREVKSIYNKFQTVLPKLDQQSKVVIQLNPLMQTKEIQEVINKITFGQDYNRVLEITYRNAAFEASLRRVHPYTLVMYGSAWYLYGYCELRSSFRLFKLSRVTQCDVLSEVFDLKEMPNPLPWQEENSYKREGTLVKLEIDRVLEGKLPEYFEHHQCEFHPDKIIVTLNFPVDEWYYSLLLGLVPHVKVLEPEWVRTEFVDRLKKSIALNEL